MMPIANSSLVLPATLNTGCIRSSPWTRACAHQFSKTKTLLLECCIVVTCIDSFRYSLCNSILSVIFWNLNKNEMKRSDVFFDCMFFRTNIVSHCSFTVKFSLFRSYCLSLYDIGLWRTFTVSCMNKLRSCYNKCIKSFFGYHRIFSVTQALLQSGLPSFDTVLHNGACVFIRMWPNS